MDVKTGTQTWSPAQQESGLKPQVSQTMTSEQREQVFGGKDLGEILNKVADPNWVDPAKMRQVGNAQLGKDAFLKLLLAQLKNQDPTTPMESHEMAAQLAQFTSLEKLTNINEGIDKLAAQSNPKMDFNTLQLIGKNVSGDSSRILRDGTESQHTVKFNLAADASIVKARIKNSEGQVVKEIELAHLKKGNNELNWNGISEDGATLGKGEYNVSLEAQASSGQNIFAATTFEGKISGVNFTAEGPVFLVGDQTVRLSDVKKITDPTIHPPSGHSSNGPVNNKVSTQGQTPQKASSNPVALNSDLMKDVSLSREIMNKIKKETGADSPSGS